MESKVKVCPFCGSEKIEYSIKTTGRWERKYHVAMYCRDCNCYGKRILITPTEDNRYDVERNPYYKQLAIEAWNTRVPVYNMLKELDKETTMLVDVRAELSHKRPPTRESIASYTAAGERLAEAILCKAIVEEENNKCMK